MVNTVIRKFGSLDILLNTEEMAAAVVFLASDEAAYITGQTLFVDVGLTLYADFRES